MKVIIAVHEKTAHRAHNSSVGMKPDPSKIKAIKEIGTPQDKKELLRFIGLVNYLGKFIPGLSDMTQPLRGLLKTEIEWHWSSIGQARNETV